MRVVNDVLRVLQLGPVQHSLVGGFGTRGVSGGQRKRVNIGYELVALPTLLFLDEPTSGACACVCVPCVRRACVCVRARARACVYVCVSHVRTWLCRHALCRGSAVCAQRMQRPSVLPLRAVPPSPDRPTGARNVRSHRPPPAGLDATATNDIVYSLKLMTELGMSIITVIHQPRCVRCAMALLLWGGA